jgi:hypothetical protein
VIGKVNGVINFDLISTLSFNPDNLVYSIKEIFFRSPGWNSFYWISELIGFAIVPVISYFGLKQVVFCEDCNKWTNDMDFKLHLDYESIEQLQDIAERNIEKLLDLPIAENRDQNHIVVNFQSCDSCSNTNTVSFELVKFISTNGTVTRVNEDYGSIILISSALFESLKRKLPETGKATILNTDQPDQIITINKIYEKSGKFGSIVLIGSIFGLFLIPLLSLAYGYVLGFYSMSPIIEFSSQLMKLGLFCVVLSILVFANVKIATLSKCRNSGIILLFFFIFSFLVYYLSWVCFVCYKMNGFISFDAITTLILNPFGLYAKIKSIYNFSLDWTLYYWIAELIGFAAVPFLSLPRIMEHVFCEDCNKWATEMDFKLHLVYDTPEQLQEIAERNVQKLMDLPLAENLDQNHIIVNFHTCKSCLNTNTLNFDLVTCSMDKGDSPDDVNKKREDYSPVICISSSELEAFKNRAEEAKKLINNQEEVEYLKTTLLEKLFYSRTWKLAMVIVAILISVTYVIEPFIGITSTVEVCESKKQVVQVTKDALVEDHVEIFYTIELARKNKESTNRSLNVPSWIVGNINKGDTITVSSTKWRKQNVAIKLQDGVIFPTKDPYAIFIVAPLILFVLGYNILSPKNKPPRKNADRKDQKVHRYYYLIINFLFSIAVFLFLYMSVKNLF